MKGSPETSPKCCDRTGQFGADAVFLQSVFLHVTKACNLNCSYCYLSARSPMRDEMATAEFDSLWPQLVEARPKKVVFTGGEPLLRRDIIGLLTGLRDADQRHSVIRCLNSNGHLVTPGLAAELVGLADEVRVSIDAFAWRNDAHRGTGSYDAAMRALDVYRAAGFDPKVLVTVTRQTLPDLEELLLFLILRGYASINLHKFRPIGRGEGHEEWCVDEPEIKQSIRRASARLGSGEVRVTGPGDEDLQQHCGAGRFLNIMPNGDVFPCHVLNVPEFRCGSLRTQKLADICRRTGLLGQLARLDFRAMARQEPRVASLTKPGTCLGTVYAENHALGVWQNYLSLPVIR